MRNSYTQAMNDWADGGYDSDLFPNVAEYLSPEAIAEYNEAVDEWNALVEEYNNKVAEFLQYLRNSQPSSRPSSTTVRRLLLTARKWHRL